jgi:Fic family protein
MYIQFGQHNDKLKAEEAARLSDIQAATARKDDL